MDSLHQGMNSETYDFLSETAFICQFWWNWNNELLYWHIVRIIRK